jgi:uncharacterized protein
VKFTLCVTQRCTLTCDYCYVDKRNVAMSHAVASSIIDWAFLNTPPDEPVEIGFFGGEPLLEFETIRDIVAMIKRHPGFDPERVFLTVVSNGTVWSDDIAEFLRRHRIAYCLSFDGPPHVHDRFRRFPNGRGSSSLVEQTARQAMDALGLVPVNAVYRPETFRELVGVVRYLASLGFRHIYLNPDLTASWTRCDAECLPEVYGRVADQYMEWYLADDPRFVSLIDSKIAVLLRGGYQPAERCRMGRGEFAFTPEGNVYPCERLIGQGTGGAHCLGNVSDHFAPLSSSHLPAGDGTAAGACRDCGLKELCVNWCGCSNYFSTGHYDRVGPFLCASERAAIATAARVFETLEASLGPTFANHLAGSPYRNSTRMF